ncbi:MAG: hypothetical protein ABW021_11630 [Acidimicrobiia bacterium]|jgi:hypothetical protein
MTTPEQPTQPTPEQRPTWPGWWVILGAVIVLVAILAVVYLGDGDTDDTTVTTDNIEESGTTSPDVATTEVAETEAPTETTAAS